MDTFVEQIVKKKKGGREYAVIFGSIVGAILLLLVLFLFAFQFIGGLFLFLVAGAGYGVWWLCTTQNIEFEYSVTNGDIDIDQIIAQRKRKRIVSVSGEKIETMAPYKPEDYVGRKFDRMVIAAPSTAEQGLWCFTYHSKKSGSTLVIFQPEERVLKSLVSGLQRLLQLEIKRNYLQ